MPRQLNDSSNMGSTTERSVGRTAIELAMVIPTFNERENIFPLHDALAKTLAGVEWEVMFVDDNSPDGTADSIRELAVCNPRVHVLERIGRHGLSSACIEGMRATSAQYVVVMDADLQHDESIVLTMLERMKSEHLDIVIASRKIAGGSMGNLPWRRILLSALGSQLSRLVCHCAISDPMSGFFIVDRMFFEQLASKLSGRGFKILLDLLASSPRSVRLAEVPYRFRSRQFGKSKLNVGINLAYLRLLGDKLIARVSGATKD